MPDTTSITARSTIADWLDHPVGGKLLRDLLAAGGKDESALNPVRSLSLQRIADMRPDMLDREQVKAMVLEANGGVTPADDVTGEWVEKTTHGRFADQTVIITGAGSGIGRATASRVAREGGRVIAVDIAEDRLSDLTASLPEGDIVPVVADITRQTDVDLIVETAGERIDGLANVAGVLDEQAPLHEVTDAVWERVFTVNVDGTMRLSRAVLPAMLAARRGSIVNIISEAGLRGGASGVAYSASKHAVVGMTRNSAFMYADSGIRVNAVAPGGVATSIQAKHSSEFASKRLGVSMQILPGVATPEQLAASITFLLSDDGTNVTGAILPSDGGWSAI